LGATLLLYRKESLEGECFGDYLATDEDCKLLLNNRLTYVFL